MSRNTSITSFISNINTTKKTFKSYIDLDVNSESEGHNGRNTDEVSIDSIGH